MNEESEFCPLCAGSGEVGDDRCPHCAGTGEGTEEGIAAALALREEGVA